MLETDLVNMIRSHLYSHSNVVIVCINFSSVLTFENLSSCICIPPKNGKIALLLTTNGLMCSKHVSQKRNEAIVGRCECVNFIHVLYIHV